MRWSVMTNNNPDLGFIGFILTLTSFISNLLNSLHDLFVSLPHDFLANFISVSIVSILLCFLFIFLTRGKPPNLFGPIKIPAWIPPTIICSLLSILLLFWASCFCPDQTIQEKKVLVTYNESLSILHNDQKNEFFHLLILHF